MEVQTIVEQLLANPATLPALPHPLPDAVAAAVVERLKHEADRHWWINANRSLELAGLIEQIGQQRGDLRQAALGTMARGDALKFLGQLEAAWEALDVAGRLFQAAGDLIGWSRTRIGRLVICVDLNRVAPALTDAEQARAILLRQGELEKCMRLDLNTAIVYYLLGNQHQALALYRRALAAAEELCAAGTGNLDTVYTNMGLLYTNMGVSHELLGDFRQALAYHEQARRLFVERDETSGIALAEFNSAHIAMAQGRYRHALRLLHRARDRYVAGQLHLDAADVNRDMVECYLLLNRYAEARNLAKQVFTAYHAMGAAHAEGITLVHVATAEAELGNLATAQVALNMAEAIFAGLTAAPWLAMIRLRRSQIALKQGGLEAAHAEAGAAAQSFVADGQQVNYATATLVQGQALLAAADCQGAAQAGATVLHIARRCNVPPLRYSAHLLLGRSAEADGRLTRAARHYAAAIATVARVQQGLTITLRPGFLEDKGEALRALIKLHLRAGRAERAITTLERARSQALLGYLTNREQLRWDSDDPHSQALIAELNELRAEHQWFYRLAQEQPPGVESVARAVTPEEARAEVAARERRMRAITEQLYLLSGAHSPAWPATPPPLSEVQRRLDPATLLVEFYNDGSAVWAFALDAQSLEVYALPMTVAEIDQLLAQLQSNFAFALKAGPQAPVARTLTDISRRLLQRLYAALLEPLAARLAGRKRLLVAPYGALHCLPFHLLHTGAAYLIEQCEVAILPTASLLTRPAPRPAAGARVLAHSWDGRLTQTRVEAALVQELFGGEVYCDEAASREVLQARPAQILHIAAHGEHRLDQPDLSYIQLGDGQLWTDDLLQTDMGYELVTLSACETGRASVAAGDELIGLGRGFLYAGAGALLVSLWRVADEMTVTLMTQIYRALHVGAARAAALREAQRAILAATPHLHPAFWGAFQLVGDPGPLSTRQRVMIRKEQSYGIYATA